MSRLDSFVMLRQKAVHERPLTVGRVGEEQIPLTLRGLNTFPGRAICHPLSSCFRFLEWLSWLTVYVIGRDGYQFMAMDSRPRFEQDEIDHTPPVPRPEAWRFMIMSNEPRPWRVLPSDKGECGGGGEQTAEKRTLK